MEKKKLLENPIAPCKKKKGTIYTGSRFKACGREPGGQGTGRSGPRSLEDDDRMEEVSAQNRYTLKQSSYI